MYLSLSARYHRAYSPVIINAGNAHFGEHFYTIKIKSDSKEYTIKGQAHADFFGIDISSYVRSFIKYGDQYAKFEIIASATGFPERNLGTFYAIRSAAQLGEPLSFDNSVGRIFTDFEVLKGYEGYPLSATIIGDGSGYYSYYDPTATNPDERFKVIPDGFITYPIIDPRYEYQMGGTMLLVGTECSSQTIWVRPSTDNVRWDSYQCQQYYIQDFTVNVKSMNELLGTVSGGGLIESESSTPIKATPVSNDIVFDAWYYNSVRRDDILQQQDFFPTENCLLEARFVLNPAAAVRWDSYQCQEELV